MGSNEDKLILSFTTNFNDAEEALTNKDYKKALDNFNSAYNDLLLSAKACDKPKVKKMRISQAEKIKEVIDKVKIKYEEESLNNDDTSEKITFKTEKSATNVTFNDVAGLHDVKDSLNNKVILPIQRPDLFESFDKKKGGGVILYGPPGTGKTLIVKALANEINASFFSMKCSDLISKYLGESESRIRELFKEARNEKLSVVFFDEFESIAKKRDSNSHESMQRVVAELLANLDGFDSDNSNVLFIAATNIPWAIDSAILRPPRFNEKIYVSLPDLEARTKLFEIKLKKVTSKEEINYNLLADKSEGLSGADIEEVCERVKTLAIRKSLDSEELYKIKTDDLIGVLNGYEPTVTTEDINKFNQYKKGA